MIAGKYRTGKYTNKNNETVYTNSVFIQELYFCGKKSDTSSSDAFVDIPEGEETDFQ